MTDFADYSSLDFSNFADVTAFRDAAIANNLILDAGFYTEAISSLPRTGPNGTSTVFYSGDVHGASGAITSIQGSGFSRIDETDLGRFLFSDETLDALQDSYSNGITINGHATPLDALYGPRGGSASQVSSSLGGLASDLFAGNASGHAIAVLTDADPSRTFGVVELERVLQNTSNTGLLSINGVSIDELRSLGSTQEAFDLLKRLSDDAVGSAFGSAYLNGAIGDRSSLVTLFEGAGLDVSNNAQFQAATELYDFQQQNNLDSIDFSGTTRALRLLDAAGVAGDVASIAILATQAATLYNAGRHEEAGDLLESAAVSLAGGAVGGAAGGALVAALIATFVPEPSSTLIGIGTLVGILAGGVGGDVLASSIYEGIKARVEAGETLTSDDLVNVLISAEGNCFAEGTEVDLPNQKKVPIERIQIGDQVLTYGNGSKADLTIGTVTRLFKNEVSHLLDVHGLKVTLRCP